MLVTMSSIRINNNWNYQNMLITAVRFPLSTCATENWKTDSGKQPTIDSFLKWYNNFRVEFALCCVGCVSEIESLESVVGTESLVIHNDSHLHNGASGLLPVIGGTTVGHLDLPFWAPQSWLTIVDWKWELHIGLLHYSYT